MSARQKNFRLKSEKESTRCAGRTPSKFEFKVSWQSRQVVTRVCEIKRKEKERRDGRIKGVVRVSCDFDHDGPHFSNLIIGTRATEGSRKFVLSSDARKVPRFVSQPSFSSSFAHLHLFIFSINLRPASNFYPYRIITRCILDNELDTTCFLLFVEANFRQSATLFRKRKTTYQARYLLRTNFLPVCLSTELPKVSPGFYSQTRG